MVIQPELTVDSLGEIGVGADEVRAMSAAFDILSDRLMPEASVAVAEAAVDDPEAPGNIVGFGIGEKVTRGRSTGRPAVTVLVRQKVDPDQLSEATMIPQAVNGVETDVEETGEIVAYQFRNRHRPAPGSVSICNGKENAAGTLGCWVRSKEGTCILSTNHVLAMGNDGSEGDPIAQPGRLDDGVCPGDAIAKLLDWVKINFSGGSNEVDAAIALAALEDDVDPRIVRGRGRSDMLADPHTKARLGMKVQKSGRTTGWTLGAVDLVATTINVNYNPPPLAPKIARFDNQFRISARTGAFSGPGDSGSLVTTDLDNHPVGLLFAGSEIPSGPKMTFCNDIDRVLTALNASIYY